MLLLHLSHCVHANRQPHTHADRQEGRDRREIKQGDGNTQKQQRGEGEGHLPHPSGYWTQSVRFSWTPNKGGNSKSTEIKKMHDYSQKIKMWVRAQNKTGMRSEFREEWEGGRVGQLGCRWRVQKNREGQIHRKWKQCCQEDIQCTNISPKETQTTPHATT